MKRIPVFLILSQLAFLPIAAGTRMGFLNHLSVNASASTYGIGGEIAMPLGEYLSARAGFNFCDFSYEPGVQKYDTEFRMSGTGTKAKATVEINPIVNITNSTYDVMMDFYPSVSSNLHITAGAFVGNPEMANASVNILDVSSTDPSVQVMGEGYVKQQLFGDASVSNVNVNVDGLNEIRPYAGIGFGRAVPTSRVGLMLEFGAIMHGMPRINDRNRLLDSYDEAKKIKGILTREVFSGSALFPVIRMSLTFRFF